MNSSAHTYSRKSKEGHAYHAERGPQQTPIPGFGDFIAVADGGERDLVKTK